MLPLVVKIAFTLVAVAAMSMAVVIAVELIMSLVWSRYGSKSACVIAGILPLGVALLAGHMLLATWIK